MNVASPLCSTLFICSLDQSPPRARTIEPGTTKVYPWEVPPRMSCRSLHPHVMPLQQSAPRVDSLKYVAHPIWFIPLCSVMLFNMVNSLQALVLYAVPLTVLFDMLKTLWHLPLKNHCLRALFRRGTPEELRDLAKTLPWDHPIARKLDHEVHRRRMAGESYRFFYRPIWGPFLPSHPFLFLVCRCVSQSRFSSARPVAHPLLSSPSASQSELGGAFLGPNLFVLIFFLALLDFLEDQPVCHIYQWVARPTHGSVCNY